MYPRLFSVVMLLVVVADTNGVACDDDPAAVEALKAIKASVKCDEEGAVIYVDVSARDDINDEFLVHLSGLPRLREFHAIYTRITGSRLKHLRQSEHLEVLDLYACPVTDEGLVHLKDLSQLRHVNLIGSRVTDSSIDTLTAWKKLEYLGVGDSQISREGIQKLEAALPDCIVD